MFDLVPFSFRFFNFSFCFLFLILAIIFSVSSHIYERWMYFSFENAFVDNEQIKCNNFFRIFTFVCSVCANSILLRPTDEEKWRRWKNTKRRISNSHFYCPYSRFTFKRTPSFCPIVLFFFFFAFVCIVCSISVLLILAFHFLSCFYWDLLSSSWDHGNLMYFGI